MRRRGQKRWKLAWRVRGELSCKEVGRVLQTYLDGELDELRAQKVAQHLEDCLRCGMTAETYADIKRALRRSAGAVPEETLERLRAFGDQLVDGDDPSGSEEPSGA